MDDLRLDNECGCRADHEVINALQNELAKYGPGSPGDLVADASGTRAEPLLSSPASLEYPAKPASSESFSDPSCMDRTLHPIPDQHEERWRAIEEGGRNRPRESAVLKRLQPQELCACAAKLASSETSWDPFHLDGTLHPISDEHGGRRHADEEDGQTPPRESAVLHQLREQGPSLRVADPTSSKISSDMSTATVAVTIGTATTFPVAPSDLDSTLHPIPDERSGQWRADEENNLTPLRESAVLLWLLGRLLVPPVDTGMHADRTRPMPAATDGDLADPRMRPLPHEEYPTANGKREVLQEFDPTGQHDTYSTINEDLADLKISHYLNAAEDAEALGSAISEPSSSLKPYLGDMDISWHSLQDDLSRDTLPKRSKA